MAINEFWERERGKKDALMSDKWSGDEEKLGKKIIENWRDAEMIRLKEEFQGAVLRALQFLTKC